MKLNHTPWLRRLIVLCSVFWINGCISPQSPQTSLPIAETLAAPSPLSPSESSTYSPTPTFTTPTSTINPSPTHLQISEPRTNTPEPFTYDYFKLAFSILDGPLQGRWVLDLKTEVTTKVFSGYTGIDKWPWSHDGSRLAAHFTQNDLSGIRIIDVEKGTDISIMLSGSFSAFTNFYVAGQPQWSYDDRWLAYSESGEIGNDFVVKTWLVNAETLEVIKLTDGTFFSAWSNTTTTQYLYLYRDLPPRSDPEEKVEGQTTIHVGEVGLSIPIYSFPYVGETNTPGRGWDILWRPDNQIAISHGYGPTDQKVIRLSFVEDSWEIVHQQPGSENSITPLFWSPDGQWIVIARGNGKYYLWQAQDSNDPFEYRLPAGAFPMAWTNDSRYLIYFKDTYLYAVEPARPSEGFQFFDLSSYGISEHYSLDLWIPPD